MKRTYKKPVLNSKNKTSVSVIVLTKRTKCNSAAKRIAITAM